MSGTQIANRRFIDLYVFCQEYFGANLVIDRTEPVGSQSHPASHRLTGKLYSVAAGKNLFLSVKRKMITVFSDNDLGKQSWCGDAAFLQAFRQRRNDGCYFFIITTDIFMAD